MVQSINKGSGFGLDFAFTTVTGMRASSREIDFVQPYVQNAWIYGAVKSIADNISSVPFVIGEGEERELTEDNILKPSDKGDGGKWATVFTNPNPKLTASQLWEATLVLKGIHGEAFWVLTKSEAEGFAPLTNPTEIPGAIFVINPEYFTPLFAEDDLFRVPVAWELSVSLSEVNKVVSKENIPNKNIDRQNNRAFLTFLDHEIVHHKYYNPFDDVRGMPPMQAALMSARQDFKASVFNEDFFDNNAQPGGILSAEGALTEGQIRSARRQFEGIHRGGGKAFRTAILSGGMKWQSLSESHDEMGFIEQRKWNRDEVLAVYKVPKAELSVYEDINFATAQSQDRNYWTKNLLPKMKYFIDLTFSKLFMKRNTKSKKFFGVFDTTVVESLQEDTEGKMKIAKDLYAMGVPFNDINKRLRLRLPDQPWGNEGFMNGSIVTATRIVENSEAEPVDPNAGNEDEGNEDEEKDESTDTNEDETTQTEEQSAEEKFILLFSESFNKGLKRELKNFVYKMRVHQLSRDGEVFDADQMVSKFRRSFAVYCVECMGSIATHKSIRIKTAKLAQTHINSISSLCNNIHKTLSDLNTDNKLTDGNIKIVFNRYMKNILEMSYTMEFKGE